ncbi:S49 family peptidase [Alphaproteobacteria bacterium]|nr:S49 family peptidase [Alphaproteobacteria bacterium]
MTHFFNAFAKILGFCMAISAFVIIIGLVTSFINRSTNQSSFSYLKGDKASANKIAILNISGPIISEPNNFYNFTRVSNSGVIYPSLIENYLSELQKENALGLIVSINSPGGSVSASYTIYNLFNQFKIKNKTPLYFYSTDMLTSGAYWVSLSANKIFTNYGALVGSIGVKGPDWIYYNSPTSLSTGLLGSTVESSDGIELYTNTAGISKDILNPFRKPSMKEISQLQNMVNNIYNDFVNLVSSSRKIEKNIVVNEIGAMIYNSKEAQKNYLIDGQININEAIEMMAKELNLVNKKIISNNKKNLFNFQKLNFFTNVFDIKKYNLNEMLINKKFCNNIKNEFSVATFNFYSLIC